MFVLKLKGIKKTFSEDPINYKKVRKGDVHNSKGKFYKQYASKFKIADTSITEMKRTEHSSQLLIFIHGGAFISGPSQIHWDSAKTITKESKHTIWMCNYPKAPENKIDTISENIDQVYQEALKEYKGEQITLMGDSVGGTLSAALVQRLIKSEKELPSKIILISPVMDSTLLNPAINILNDYDPMLSKKGILSAKKMCALDGDLQDERMSPNYGSYKNFPKTILFLATNDITYPDQQETVIKLKEAQVKYEVIKGEYMPHIWPFLPVMKEAKIALAKIISILNQRDY